MPQQINSFEWEINEFQDKQKKSAYAIPQILYIGLILLFFLPGLAFVFLIIAAIRIANFSQLNISSSGRGNAIVRYKIGQGGIEVENLQYNSKASYQWTDLVSYYSYGNANPLFGSLLGNRVGDDFIIADRHNNRIELRAGSSDSERVRLMLSQKLKYKLPGQSSYYSAGKSFKMTPIFGSGSRRATMNNLQGPVKKFSGGEEERRFYEQRRTQEINQRKQKESSTGKTLFVVYFVLVIFSIVYYLATAISRNDDKMIIENNLEKDNTVKIQRNKAINKDENYWYSLGWPKNDLDIVKCQSDLDCEYYFYYKTDALGGTGNKSGFNQNVRIISDSNSCAWGVINKKYHILWQERYPKPKDCVLSFSTKARKLCDIQARVCVVK